jgi:hypothetical protein
MSKFNYFLIPLIILLFIISEAVLSVYYRLLADIDYV